MRIVGSTLGMTEPERVRARSSSDSGCCIVREMALTDEDSTSLRRASPNAATEAGSSHLPAAAVGEEAAAGRAPGEGRLKMTGTAHLTKFALQCSRTPAVRTMSPLSDKGASPPICLRRWSRVRWDSVLCTANSC
jgi:hypothetical protein